MTANQINAAKLAEERRRNAVNEAETARHNRESERIGVYTAGAGYAGVSESQRHNQEQERINWYNAQVQQSHYNRGDTVSEGQLSVAEDKVALQGAGILSDLATSILRAVAGR